MRISAVVVAVGFAMLVCGLTAEWSSATRVTKNTPNWDCREVGRCDNDSNECVLDLSGAHVANGTRCSWCEGTSGTKICVRTMFNIACHTAGNQPKSCGIDWDNGTCQNGSCRLAAPTTNSCSYTFCGA